MMKMISYTSAIKSIMYVILCTWLNVFYTLSIMSRYQSNSSEIHYKMLKNIIKCLRRIKNVFLVFGGHELEVHGFLDDSFQLDIDYRKS